MSDGTGAPDPDLTSRLKAKYDHSAPIYSRRYANPEAIAAGQLRLLRDWGPKVGPGASVLELGCADGFVTERLVRAGYRVTALDISPEMIRMAGERLARSELEAELVAEDLGRFVPERRYDVVLAFMGNYLGYVSDPELVLGRLADATGQKFFIDLNPRTTSRADAIAALERAGFAAVRWRPLFVPQERRTGPLLSGALRVAERSVGVRDVMIRRYSKIVLKGERGTPPG